MQDHWPTVCAQVSVETGNGKRANIYIEKSFWWEFQKELNLCVSALDGLQRSQLCAGLDIWYYLRHFHTTSISTAFACDLGGYRPAPKSHIISRAYLISHSTPISRCALFSTSFGNSPESILLCASPCHRPRGESFSGPFSLRSMCYAVCPRLTAVLAAFEAEESGAPIITRYISHREQFLFFRYRFRGRKRDLQAAAHILALAAAAEADFVAGGSVHGFAGSLCNRHQLVFLFFFFRSFLLRGLDRVWRGCWSGQLVGHNVRVVAKQWCQPAAAQAAEASAAAVAVRLPFFANITGGVSYGGFSIKDKWWVDEGGAELC